MARLICRLTKYSLDPESSGIRATEIELIRVPEMVRSGITIPVTTPKAPIASLCVNPFFTIIVGKIREIIKLTTLDPILRIAIGEDSNNKGLISFRFGLIFPPLIKYTAIAKMDESPHAREYVSPAISAPDKDMASEKQIKQQTNLKICSISSVKPSIKKSF